MAKIIANKSIYDEYDHKYFYEKRYEANIIPHLRRIFTDYFILKFNPIIINTYNDLTKSPDILMIKKDYKEWIIVEVEKKDHTLKHILDQTEVFQNGNYIEKGFLDYTKKIIAKVSQLNSNKLFKLIKKKPPIILIIINGYKLPWLKEFKKNGLGFIIFEVYKDFELAFRVDGDLPYIYEKKVRCVFEQESTQILKLANKNFIPEDKRKVKLIYSSRYSDWTVKRINNELFLEPKHYHTLDITAEYKLYKKHNNIFHLVKE